MNQTQEQQNKYDALITKYNMLVREYNALLKIQIGCEKGKIISIIDGRRTVLAEHSKKPCLFYDYATTIPLLYLEWSKDFVCSKRDFIHVLKIFFKMLWYPHQQPKHLTDFEKGFIQQSRIGEDPVSIGVLAEILCRSKSTIHEALKK
jgi:hypothetical protein